MATLPWIDLLALLLVGIVLVSLSARVTSVKSAQGLSLSSGPIDRTPGIPGSDKKMVLGQTKCDLSHQKVIVQIVQIHSISCHLLTSDQKLMNNHWSSPSGAWPLRCPLCGRGFSKQTALRSHMLMHAGEEREHRCSWQSSHILRHAGEVSSRNIATLCDTRSKICQPWWIGDKKEKHSLALSSCDEKELFTFFLHQIFSHYQSWWDFCVIARRNDFSPSGDFSGGHCLALNIWPNRKIGLSQNWLNHGKGSNTPALPSQ